jgi:hypothetical protein
VTLAVVECRCADEAIWQERITARQHLALPAHHATTWDAVQRFLRQPEADYPIVDPRFFVDTTRPLADLADEVTTWLVSLRRLPETESSNATRRLRGTTSCEIRNSAS